MEYLIRQYLTVADLADLCCLYETTTIPSYHPSLINILIAASVHWGTMPAPFSRLQLAAALIGELRFPAVPTA